MDHPAITETRPLAGVVVADFTRVLSGPTATMLLADLGAEVIKVERPGVGDDTRAWGPPFRDGTSTYYLAANRGKRSIAVDLTSPQGLQAARDIVRQADIVMENFSPGTMARLGLGYDDARKLREDIVYCSISGFGSQGRGASMPGYDFVAQAVGGLMSITGEPDGEPMKVGVALVDILVGHHALIGVLAALRRQQLTGEGTHVEVNLLSSLLSSLANQGSAYVAAGEVPTRAGNVHPSIAPYELLRTGDEAIAVAVGNEKQFAALSDALGRHDLALDERFATNALRVANRSSLRRELESSLLDLPADEVLDKLAAAGVPSGRVNSIAEAFELAEDLGLAPIQRPGGENGVPQVSPPFRFGGMVPSIDRAAPRLDEHCDDIYAWLCTLGTDDNLQ